MYGRPSLPELLNMVVRRFGRRLDVLSEELREVVHITMVVADTQERASGCIS